MCPPDMEATYEEYTQWSESPVPNIVTQSYKRAVQQMALIKPYEESLVTRNYSRVANIFVNIGICPMTGAS